MRVIFRLLSKKPFFPEVSGFKKRIIEKAPANVCKKTDYQYLKKCYIKNLLSLQT